MEQGLREEVVKLIDQRIEEVGVRRSEFDELRQVMVDLAKAQKRADDRVADLAEAQKRTEQRLNELAEAQKKTEQRFNELAEAQMRTEDTIARLFEVVETLRRDMEALRAELGISLEELGEQLLPPVLKERYGVEVPRLHADYVTVRGVNIEFDLIGDGIMAGEKVLVVGEVKTRFSPEELRRFSKIVKKLAAHSAVKVVPFIFARRLARSVAESAEKEGIIAICGTHI